MAKKKSESKPASKSGSEPLIDTNAAANAAAALIGSKLAAASGGAAPQKESAAFKQLKAGLNKPSAGALGGAFAVPNKHKKSNQAFGGGKQIGQQNTRGTDATRSGVPRRTAG